MSFLPSTIVVLESGLTEEQSSKILKKLEKLKGVANAHFKDAVKKDLIEVAFSFDANITVTTEQKKAVEQQAKKIPGVAKVGYGA
jgi:cell division protein FtsX